MFVFYYISVLAYKYDLSLYIILIKNEKKSGNGNQLQYTIHVQCIIILLSNKLSEKI